MSSKLTRKTSAKSSADRGASSAGSARSSKPRPPARAPESTSTSSNSPEFLVVAQVLAPHGIRGEVKCRVITDFPKQRFKRGNTILVRRDARTVESARFQGANVLLKLSGVPDRNVAETLRGADVEVAVADALALPKGQFYWHQVIGLSVVDATSQQVLGTIADIIETGANDVYLVRGERGEILIPAIKDVIKLISPEEGRMVVEPLPGMIPR